MAAAQVLSDLLVEALSTSRRFISEGVPFAGGAIRYECGEAVSGRCMEDFRTDLWTAWLKIGPVPKHVFCCLLIVWPMLRYRR